MAHSLPHSRVAVAHLSHHPVGRVLGWLDRYGLLWRLVVILMLSFGMLVYYVSLRQRTASLHQEANRYERLHAEMLQQRDQLALDLEAKLGAITVERARDARNLRHVPRHAVEPALR